MTYPEIKTIAHNPDLAGFARCDSGIVFSNVVPGGLKLALLRPWAKEDGYANMRRPLVVFLQGSGWTFPDIGYELPQLSKLARKGYVVATITHRNALDGCPFPAYLQDTKTAIRFLRAHAAEYGIDKERVCMFGTSSGGNTALLVGLTGDDARFRTDEYPDESDTVQAVAECFGPTDMTILMKGYDFNKLDRAQDLFCQLVGDNDPQAVMRGMSPVNYIRPGAQYPPMLLLHGDKDDIVPYEQGVLMYEKLCDAGVDARMVRVIDAPHEGSFWSRELLRVIHGFIAETLG